MVALPEVLYYVVTVGWDKSYVQVALSQEEQRALLERFKDTRHIPLAGTLGRA